MIAAVVKETGPWKPALAFRKGGLPREGVAEGPRACPRRRPECSPRTGRPPSARGVSAAERGPARRPAVGTDLGETLDSV